MDAMYKRLHIEKLIDTLEVLRARVLERFPEASLAKVCDELLIIANNSKDRIAWIARANKPVRISVSVVFILALAGIWISAHNVEIQVKKPSSSDVVQIIDAFLSTLVLLGGSSFFLFSLESRIKRQRALNALHELRAIAHVIDLHQLRKDPYSSLNETQSTPSSPARDLNAFQLRRYLDYCAEMLSLVGKLAALYSQKLPDADIVSAANEIEILCSTMSQKVWQKIQALNEPAA